MVTWGEIGDQWLLPRKVGYVDRPSRYDQKNVELNVKPQTYKFIYNKTAHNIIIIMPPFEEEGVYCFAYVGLSVDQMVSADYLKYHSSQSLHMSHVDWL